MAGLKRVDPAGASDYESNLASFARRIDVSLYGEELVDLLGSETLEPLAREDKLIEFLKSREYGGRPLMDRLGGWLGDASSFRGAKIVAYHSNWIYLTRLLGLEVVDFVERKPGIPPSARHVHELLGKIESQGVKVLLGANYFSRSQIETIADRAGCEAVIVALSPMEAPAEGYFELVDGWITDLKQAFDS
jgi:ABC-type Zn uptake system ZnuABC Zn-binding protein ZnuA